MKRAAILLMLAFAAAAPLRAADNLRAVVAFGSQKESTYDLIGRKGDKISLTALGAGGLISMPTSSISSLKIDRPKEFALIADLLGRGKADEAVTRLGALAALLLPYTDVPHNNAVDLVCDVVDLLRSADRYKEGLDILGKIASPGAGSNTVRIDLLKAYCLSALGKTLEAQTVLNAGKPPERGDPLYPVAKIVQGRVLLTMSNITEALDQVAQAAVDTPIENEYYPESMFVAASCYEALAAQTAPAKTPAQPGGKSDSERLMEQSSGNARSAAAETYTLLVQMAPESRWAQLAKERLKKLGAEAPPPDAAPGAQVPADAAPQGEPKEATPAAPMQDSMAPQSPQAPTPATPAQEPSTTQ